MDSETRKYISSLVGAIIESYKIETPIKDIDKIVTQMGGRTEPKDYFNDFCDASIRKDGDNSFVIAISTFTSDKRRNFTIAHELGHLFLHMGYLTNKELWNKQGDTVYRRFGSSEQEYQANEFAAALLMPEHLFRKTVEDNTHDNMVEIAEVAKFFNVSISAAINRGRFLGCLA